MNCPHCGWSLKLEKDWVDRNGYHGIFTCNSFKCCEVEVKATTNLLWAYDNNRLPKELRQEASSILLSSGLLSTPP